MKFMKRFLLIAIILSGMTIACGEKTVEHGHKDMPVDKVVSLMDNDHNGEVSRQEFNDHFHAKDLDKNGVISKEEMRKHHINVHGNDEKFDDRFSGTDTDNNSEVSEEECMTKFDKMDGDHNDSLTKKEFMDFMKQSH